MKECPWLTCRAPAPDAINSAEYEARILEVGSMEVMGRGRSLRRPARVAVSAGWANARLAQHLRLVWACSAFVGAPFAGLCGIAASAAPRLSDCLSLRRSVVHRQLLLGARHHAPLRRYAAGCAHSASHWLQFGAGALLWSLRPGSCAGTPGNGQHAPGACFCAHPLGCIGTGRRTHHICSLGPARLLAGG